jgi:hypothetical protein
MKPIMMEVEDISGRQRQLARLSADIGSTVGLGRVVGGTSTAAAIDAAQNAVSEMYTELKGVSTALTSMAAILARRIAYMKEFGKEYPIPYATEDGIRHAAERLARDFAKNPKEHYEELQRYAIDPDFAAGFVKTIGPENLASLIRDQLRVPAGPDHLLNFEHTIGLLVGSATRVGALTERQLAALFHDNTLTRGMSDLQFGFDDDAFFDGLASGAHLEPVTIRAESNKALALTRALIDHAVEVAGADYAASKGFVHALDLALAHDARAVYLQLAVEMNRGDKAGLGFTETRTAIGVVLSGEHGLQLDKSALIEAIGALSALKLRLKLEGAKGFGQADSIAEFDSAYDELERVMEAVSVSAKGRTLALKQDQQDFDNAIRLMVYKAFVAGVASLATAATGPTGGLLAGQLGRIDVTSHQAAALAAALEANAGTERAARDVQFAAAKLNYLKSIKADPQYWPRNYQKYFEWDPAHNSFTLRPGIEPGHSGLGEMLLDKDV